MTNWLIYEPPGGAQRTLEDAARFVTVREGFSKLALVAPFVWLIWRRCWLALAAYIAVELALALVAGPVGLRGGSALLFALLPNLAVAFEAAWLRARALERQGFKLAGSVPARTREEAEAYFFADWLEGGDPERAAPAQGQTPYRPQGARVLGLFPQPGAAR